MTICFSKSLMSSSLNSHRTNARDSSYYHQHQSHLETISPESSSPTNVKLKSEKRHCSSTIKKKHEHNRRRSSDKDSDNDNKKSRRTTTSAHRSSPSNETLVNRNSQRSSSSKQYSRYYNTRHTFDTSSNQVDFEIINKKRKHYHTDNNHSSKKHRRASPSTIYSSNHHRSRSSKHRRRSSSSSTCSSERNHYSISNEFDNNQTGKLTKGTLGSELDKLRPKTRITTIQTNENDVCQSASSIINPPTIGQTHLTRLLPMPPDYKQDSLSPSSPTNLSPNQSDKPIRRPL